MGIARSVWLALLLACGCATTAAWGQLNPTLTEAERGVRSDRTAQATHLGVRALTLDVHVVGRTADVTLEMVIASNSRTPFEAKLSLALPPGAVVNGYALDIDGRMIPGVLLEAPKARNVYEDEVRAGVDPGLAEVAGNRFTTRIFPIDADHPRRLRLRFATAFDPATGIALPIERDAALAELKATVTVEGYATPPTIRIAGRAVTLAGSAARRSGTLELRDTILRDGLAIDGGTLAAPLAVSRHAGGETFFVISDGGAMARAEPRKERLRVYWDRSVSHRAARPDLERDALLRLIDASGPSGIDLVTFASDRPQTRAVATAAELRRALDDIVYRGASSLKGLDTLALPKAGRCILVFDGQVTIDRAATFAPDCRVTALTAAADADAARLGRIAGRSGGALVRVAEGQIARAATALAAWFTGPVAVETIDGSPLAFRALPANAGEWQIVGPMPRRGGVRLRFADGAVRSYAPVAAAAVPSDAAGVLWAQDRLLDLADDPARHEAMADLARRYQVAGPGMSFLVLERPDQYLHADIAPPPGFSPAWLEDYARAKADEKRAASDVRRKRLDFVVEQWRERRDWWATKFTPQRASAKRGRPSFDLVDSPPPPAPPPPSEPAPPPPAVMAPAPIPAPAAEAMDGGDMIVTAVRVEPAAALRQSREATARTIGLSLPDLLAKRPYLAALDAAAASARLAVLAEQERAYGSVPAFYLDVAEWFRLKGDAAIADALLLSALDLPTSDDETRQIVAFRLERDGGYDRAVELAEHLAAANAEFRPQPGRDLALALAARGRARGSVADLQHAFALLTETALNPASSDFDGIEVIALMEANALIPAIAAAGGRWSLDPRLVGLTDTDARIVIAWTADDADIDLWVDEPNGERVYYSDKLSSAGGQISNDMTDGYGPEEYAIRRAPPGSYQVRINGYDADRINPNGPGHVLIRLYRNFARPGERQDMVDADLSFQTGRNRDRQAETRPVATLEVGSGAR